MEISVIVPVYNGEMVLRRCLDSITAQTYPKLEIIIVNDGSTDKTKSIIEEYTDKYSNIFAVHKENEGLPQARRTGVQEAFGDYIGFVDADDWIEENMYAEMIKTAKHLDADVVCCGISLDQCNGTEKKIEFRKNLILKNKSAIRELHKRKCVFSYMWNKIFRKELFENIVYPTGNFIGEDYMIVTQLLQKADTVVQIGTPFYHYVQVKGSMCRGGYNDSYVLSYYNYQKRQAELCRKFPELKEEITNYIQTEYMSFIVAMGKNEIYNMNMVQKIREYVKENRNVYIKADYVEIKYKLSAISLLINYKLLIAIYRIIGR